MAGAQRLHPPRHGKDEPQRRRLHGHRSVCGLRSAVHSPFLVLALLILFVPVALADHPLEIIPLKHQTVEQMVPLLRPFVEEGGTVTGMNGQLVIRTSPENLAELKKIIQRFDRVPRQLRIAVRQGGAGVSTRRGAGVQGRVPVGEKGTVVIGRPGPREGVEARVQANRKQWSTDAERYVRTTEGMPAFIQSGLSVPTITRSVDPWGRYRVEEQYHDVTSGFYVTPWINGDRVTLEISPFAAEPSGTPRSYRIQEMTTRITGRLGEWIPIGGTAQRRQGSSGGITRYSTGSVESQEPIEVKVELLDP